MVILLVIIVIIIYIIITFSNKRYYRYYPTINFLYPNNEEEVKLVVNATNKRTMDDIRFFELTDSSVIYAFMMFLPELDPVKLKKVILSQNKKIHLLKRFINRPRPIQISKNIKLLKSKTAATPSFPAGHAAQAYILANYLSKIYPIKKNLFEKIADRCNDCRIKAGLHYPSDGQYSKLIFYKRNE